jgi:predicted phage tail protein
MKDVHGGWPFGFRRTGPRALAATCLAAAMAGGPALPGGLALGAGAIAAPALMVELAPGLEQAPSEAPADLTATAGTGQVTLRWTAPASQSSFTIYHGTSPDPGQATEVGTVTGTGAVVTGLTGGTAYYFWVTVAGESVVSNMATATPLGVPRSAPPTAQGSSPAPAFPAPTELTAADGDGQVSLTWAAPVSDGGSPVTSYNVYQAASPGSHDATRVGSARGTNATVIGLTNGTTYYFTVTAVNAAGKVSQFSAEVSARPDQRARAVVASLTTPVAPKKLIALLAAIGVTATAGAIALAVWGRRQNSRPPPRPGLHRRA